MSKEDLTEIQKLFIESFKENATNVSQTAKKINIHRDTYYEWCNTNPTFKKEIENAKESLIDFVESALLKNIKNGDTTAQIFFLKTRGKSRGYVERQEIDFNSVGDNELTINFKTTEELKKLINNE